MDPPVAVILAGGLGTRLRTIVGPDVPKTLAPIHGRPFLWYLLDFLRRQHVTRVLLATGHLHDQIHRALPDCVPIGMDVDTSEETTPLGTAGALKLAASKTNRKPLLVLNGDSMCATDLADLVKFHRDNRARVSMLLHRVGDVARYGSVQIGQTGRVTAFREKAHAWGPGLINAGVYVVNRDVLDPIPEGRNCSLEYDIFPPLTADGLFGYVADGPFIDIGVPESYETATKFFADWPCVRTA